MSTSAKRPAARRADKSAAGQEAAPNRKQDILLAAERLFAQRGFHGVSIRDIADEAGVQLALIGYYYGPKVSLYHEIYRQRSGYIQERLNALAEAQRSTPKARLLEEIIKAFVLPVLHVAEDPNGRNFLHLIGRGITERLEEDEPIVSELFDPLANAFIDAMCAALPEATRGQVAWCYQFALGALLHHVIDVRVERLSQGQNRAGDGASAGPLLVKLLTKGIRAACSDAPR
jgi:AcrR family transcriptional regulator